MAASSGGKALNSSMKFAPFFQINAPLKDMHKPYVKGVRGMNVEHMCLPEPLPRGGLTGEKDKHSGSS